MPGAATWRRWIAAGVLLCGVAGGCTPTVRVEHKVEPVHITMDINLRVDRELDDFFDFQQPAPQPNTDVAPATPAPAPM